MLHDDVFPNFARSAGYVRKADVDATYRFLCIMSLVYAKPVLWDLPVALIKIIAPQTIHLFGH